MKHNGLFIFIICTVVSIAYGQWFVRTTAANCGTANKPYLVTAVNMNCVKNDKIYQRVDCDGTSVTYYECASSDCDNCVKMYTQPLNKCDRYGSINQCYPNSKPDFTEYFGPHYITESFYSDKQCTGDVAEIRVYARDQCRQGSSSQAYKMTCNNGEIVQNTYNTIDCSNDPFSTYPFGKDRQCSNGQMSRCN